MLLVRGLFLGKMVFSLKFSVSCNEGEKIYIGELTTNDHGVSGKVYSCGNNQLVFENFKYDGLAPDATFWVGTEGNEPSTNGILLTYPFEGKFYDPEDFSAPVLNKAFDGTQGDIVLPLPDDVKVSVLKWISIWSREYLLNFGELIIEDDPKTENELDYETEIDESKIRIRFLLTFYY